MSENSKQKKGIESENDAGELETKRRDRIRAQCQRTRNKTKGSNLGAMQKNPKQMKGSNPGTMGENQKQKEGIEFERNTGEPETK